MGEQKLDGFAHAGVDVVMVVPDVFGGVDEAEALKAPMRLRTQEGDESVMP